MVIPQIGEREPIPYGSIGPEFHIQFIEYLQICIQIHREKPVIRNGIPEHSSYPLLLLEDDDLVAGQCQIVGYRETGWTAPHDSHLFAG